MRNFIKRRFAWKRRGFTLVELLVSMAILGLLLLVISQVLAETQRAWRQTTAKVAQFREARKAFDTLKRNLSQATLNTYVRYEFDNPSNPNSPFSSNGNEIKNAAPLRYVRFSELQFACGPFDSLFKTVPADIVSSGHGVFFQAPLGFSGSFVNMPTSMNSRGYYIGFGGDDDFKPDFTKGRVAEKFRYRLMEYAPPTEENIVYDDTTRDVQSDWYEDLVAWSRPVADNVVALYFSPRRPLGDDDDSDPRDIAPRYSYDTAHSPPDDVYPASQFNQLPPQLDVIMVVLDESSAYRVAETSGQVAPFTLPHLMGDNSNGKFKEQIDALEAYLVSYPGKLNFRIFSSTVALRNSKWGS